MPRPRDCSGAPGPDRVGDRVHPDATALDGPDTRRERMPFSPVTPVLADHGSGPPRTGPVERGRQEVVDGLDDAVLNLGGESAGMPVVHHGGVGLVSALAEDPPRGDVTR